MKQYNKKLIPFAKALRKEMTPWERKLWYCYLSKYPVRFQRQKTIGNYIIDFYCARARLAIELDGSWHYEPEQIEKDRQRTESLKSMNLIVLRICNNDVDKNFIGVCQKIDDYVKERIFLPPSAEGGVAAKP